MQLICGHDGIGRHARFRFSWSNPLGFESPCPHQQGIIWALSITGEKFGLFIACSKGSTKRTVGCQWAVKSIDFSTITDILFLSWRYLLFLGKPPTLYAFLHYERKEGDHEKNCNIQS